MKHFIWLAGVMGALAVAAGAFGAHALRGQLEARAFEVFELAARYQLYHALALLGVGILGRLSGAATWRGLILSGWFFVGGIVLFSGSLYVYSLSGIRTAAMITPLGGLCFLAGWVLLAIAGTRR